MRLLAAVWRRAGAAAAALYEGPYGRLLPYALALAFCAAFAAGPDVFSGSMLHYAREFRGNYLLAGLPAEDLTRAMPLYGVGLAAALHAGFTPKLFFLLLLFLDLLLLFCAGTLLAGGGAGLLSLLLGGLVLLSGAFGFDGEQSFYGLTLLLLFCALAGGRGAKGALLAGLAAGLTLLTRGTLLLFPPLAAAALLARERGLAGGRRAALLLAGAYALLLPWGFLNKAVTGRFELFDRARADVNLVTTAMGGIFTIEGDVRPSAGMRPGESGAGYFLRSVAADPGAYLLSAARRAWQLLLLHPFLLAAYALALAARRLPPPAALLPPFFLFMLAAFALEPRYVWPLPLLLAPVIAAAAGGAPAPAPRAALLPGAALAGLLALLSLGAALAYPWRVSGPPPGPAEVAEAWPRDPGFRRGACRALWLAGDDPGFAACSGRYGADFSDETASYFAALAAAADPLSLPFPGCPENPEPCMERALLLSLRLLALGREAEGLREFGRAYALYGTGLNMVRGEPYAPDRRLGETVRSDDTIFWNRFLPEALKWQPPAAAGRALAALEKRRPLRGRAREIKEIFNSGRAPDAALRAWLLDGGEPPGLRPPGDGKPRPEAGAR